MEGDIHDSAHIVAPILHFMHSDLGVCIFLNRLRAGGIFLKYTHKPIPNSHYRYLWLTHDLSKLMWSDKQRKVDSDAATATEEASSDSTPNTNTKLHSVMTADITGIGLGHSSPVFQRFNEHCDSPSHIPSNSSHCLTIYTHDRTIDLQCLNESDRDQWHLAFSFLTEYLQAQSLDSSPFITFSLISTSPFLSSIPREQLNLIHAFQFLLQDEHTPHKHEMQHQKREEERMEEERRDMKLGAEKMKEEIKHELQMLKESNHHLYMNTSRELIFIQNEIDEIRRENQELQQQITDKMKQHTLAQGEQQKQTAQQRD